jgi:hypothetical protein
MKILFNIFIIYNITYLTFPWISGYLFSTLTFHKFDLKGILSCLQKQELYR